MSSEITVILTTIISSVVVAGSTYLFTKWKEWESEWRKDKREYYKAFVTSLSGNVDGDATEEGKLAFNRATIDLNLIAPQRVIEALIAYREEISFSNANRQQVRHDELLSLLLYEMRKDLGMSPKDDGKTFRVLLWASGANRSKENSC